jgi:hypothetical protein
MAFAGIAGDRLGVRTVFLIAGGISLLAALVAAILYRGIAPTGEPQPAPTGSVTSA